jgi:membrane protein CcdC involved in cytochrome C biogenesis
MSLLKTFVFIEIGLAIICLMYKMYQESKLEDKNRKGTLFFWPQNYFSLSSLQKPKRTIKGDDIIIKKGNKALLLFWILFALIIIQSFLYFALKQF